MKTIAILALLATGVAFATDETKWKSENTAAVYGEATKEFIKKHKDAIYDAKVTSKRVDYDLEMTFVWGKDKEVISCHMHGKTPHCGEH